MRSSLFFRRSFAHCALAACALAFAASALGACSESTDGITDAGPLAADGSSADATSSGGNGDTGGGGSSSGGLFDAASGTSPILINEISGGDEWVEIVNASSAAIDVSGWKIADRDKTTGGPKLSEAATIPNGTSLAAGAFGMVRGGGLDAGKDCPAGGQAFCLHAEFGISKKNGETIYLIGADGGVFGSVEYPATDASTSGSTWCRIPNAAPTGHFENCPETPGAPNSGI